MSMRVGIGNDIHALVENRDLILGGVKIPYHLGLKGHSDADALIHAIIDALLGAAGLGDIGEHFPDTAMGYEGIDSRELLRKVAMLVYELDWSIVNIDTTIIAQQPKLKDFKAKMCENIANDLVISHTRVNVKAKTNECLGSLGRGEGIAAQAVVLLMRKGGDD